MNRSARKRAEKEQRERELKIARAHQQTVTFIKRGKARGAQAVRMGVEQSKER